MNKLKVFESFSGVGSQSMALRNIGINFEAVGISEVDKWALLAYDSIHNDGSEVAFKTKEEMLEEITKSNIAFNFSTGKSEIPKKEEEIRKIYEAHIRSKNYGDITKINEKELPDFDLFTYSFPCKNISVAGQQAGLEEGSGTQSALVWECRRIIKEKKPKYLMMENVKNLVGKNHKPLFDLWCKTLNELGYINYWKVLNGKNFNVPQNRERVIMISIRKDIKSDFVMPEKREFNEVILKDVLENEVDKKYFIDPSKFMVDDERLNDLTSTCTSKKLIQVGKLNTKGNESNKRVYSENGISPTLNSMNGGNRQPKVFTNDNIVRKLTPLECWRLMGYTDDDFYKAKKQAKLPESKLYERAGRGIIVPMLEDIFSELFKDTEYLNK